MIRNVGCALVASAVGLTSAGADDSVDWGFLADLYFTAEMQNAGSAQPATPEFPHLADSAPEQKVALVFPTHPVQGDPAPTSFDQLFAPRVEEWVEERWEPAFPMPKLDPIIPTYLDPPAIDGTPPHHDKGDWNLSAPLAVTHAPETPGE